MSTSQSATLSPDAASWPPAGHDAWITDPLATSDRSRPARRATTLNLNVRVPIQEGPVKAHPRRSVLRKIAARRERTERFDARPIWAAVLSGRSPRLEHSARGLARIGQRILTPREMEILYLVARGETDKRIADKLYLSRRTVNSHVSNILAKLDVPSRRAAVVVAARIGLL